MCGIFGLISLGERREPVDRSFAAIESMRHRGPDGLGVAIGSLSRASLSFRLNPTIEELRALGDHDVFLGHRRLAIIDLAPEAYQPMSNEDGRVWVVFNGEIYNHVELRRELVARGHRFATDHSDTEVLAHGYEEWGEDLVPRLRGMFGFAAIDLAKRRVLVARDPFGEKPLYFAATRSSFAFASELKGLYALSSTEKAIDETALTDYLRFGYIPAPRSIYRGVRKLRAAELATIDLDRPDAVSPRRYWELPNDAGARPFDRDEFEAELERVLGESVELRLLSDVPLGAYLSGGLDSTTIVRAIAARTGSAPKTFNIAFPEASHDESAYARRAADRYRADHHVRSVVPKDLLDLVPRVASIFDEPFADSSALPSLALAKMAREHVTVALSGDGGDELLAGYTRYAWNAELAKVFDHAPGRLLAKALEPMARAWPESARGRGLVALFQPDPLRRYESLFTDSWLIDQATIRKDGLDLTSLWDDRTSSLVRRMCKLDMELYIPEDLATKVDRTAMSVGLEVRAPLLDTRLFELAVRTPVSHYYKRGRGKLPFRRALAKDLGRAFVDRPKQGFGVPLGSWFRRELRGLLSDTIERKDAFVASIFPPNFPSTLVESHVRGTRDQSGRIWSLLALETWHKRWGGTL